MRLCNRVALVTGSSRGIGRAIALELAASGISVIINYRQLESAAAAVVREIEKTGGTALAVPADVSLPADRERLMNIVEREFGRLDILVNNAAVYRRQGLWEVDDSSWQQQIDCNLTAVFFLCQQAARFMKTCNQGGVIVNIASNAGLRIDNDQGIVYATTKVAVIHFSQLLAKSLARHQIRVNVVAPGYTDTDMAGFKADSAKRKIVQSKIPLGRANSPDDVAQVVSFLVSDRARNCTGEIIKVDGGASLG